MVSCFKKSVQIRRAIFILGIVMSVIVFMVSETPHVVIKGLYSVVIFSLFSVLSNIIALRYAVNYNKKLLDILYVEGDAEKFLHAYKEVTLNAAKGSSEYIITANYLGSGYAAAGDFKKALQVLLPLEHIQSKHHQLALKALVLNNITQVYLWLEDIAQAKEKLEALKSLRDETEGRNPSVNQNLKSNVQLFDEHLNILEGREANLEYIKEEIELSNSITHKYNMKLLLAKGFLIVEKTEDAKEILKELCLLNHQLFAVKKAGDLLENMKSGYVV